MKPRLPTPTLTAVLTFDIRPADARRDRSAGVSIVHDWADEPKPRRRRSPVNRKPVACSLCKATGHIASSRACPAREENKL